MSGNSTILFIRGGRVITLLQGQLLPTPNIASSSFTNAKVVRVCVSSYNPKLGPYKISSRNHRTLRNIVGISLWSSKSAFEVVGFSRMASDAEGEDCQFKLSETTVLKIQRGDITRWFVDGSLDAIVSSFLFLCLACLI